MTITSNGTNKPQPRSEWEAWIRSDLDVKAVDDGCWFDAIAAERVKRFCNLCKQSKGEWAGKPLVLMPWQWEEFVAPLFGWKRADGTRRYRMFYVEIPKKSGKSTLMAPIELYLLMGDGEPAAEVYTAAADRDQAGIIHDEAEKMVRASPALARRLICTTSRKWIAHPASGSKLVALSADAPTKEGLNASAVIFDELHAQRDAVLWDTLRYAGASRRQPIMGSITTAGWNRKSICWEQREIARRVIGGDYPDWSFLAVMYGADLEDDWASPVTWRKANPSLGVTIQEAELSSMCDEAKESPRKENEFKRYRLNIWTEQAVRWLPMDKWDACAGVLDAKSLLGQPCWAGLDLSSTNDITSLKLVFKPTSPTDQYKVLCYFWVPAESIERRSRRDRVPYNVWRKMGLIEETEGNVVDYGAIRAKINELGHLYSIQEIAFDPYNATATAQQLGEEDGFNVVEFRQGFVSMNEPTKALERLVISGGLNHGGNPVLRWMAGNVSVKTDPAGNLKPDKEHSTEKIDGIVSLIMALGRAGVAPAPAKASVYETRGLVTV